MSKSAHSAIPSEHQEQVALARWLDEQGCFWCHVPNERRDLAERQRLSAEGVKSGVPDVLIMSGPRGLVLYSGVRGYAIELKRLDPEAKPTARQEVWLCALRALGWHAACCHGCADAVAWLKAEWGYPIDNPTRGA